MNYWLVKSEGGCYSIADLRRDKKTAWTGIRNYQARNFMRDGMKKGDFVLLYHSEGNPSGIYGLAKVASAPHPDETADDPVWVCVDLSYVKTFKQPFPLADIKRDPKLEGMGVTRKGDRLSVQPVSEKHFEYIFKKLQ